MTEARTWPNFLMLTMKPTTFEFCVTAKCFASIPQQRWKIRQIRVHFRHDAWHPLGPWGSVSLLHTPHPPRKTFHLELLNIPFSEMIPRFRTMFVCHTDPKQVKEKSFTSNNVQRLVGFTEQYLPAKFLDFFLWFFLFVLLFMIYVINRKVLFL